MPTFKGQVPFSDPVQPIVLQLTFVHPCLLCGLLLFANQRLKDQISVFEHQTETL